MFLKVGDKVRFLNEQGEGLVTEIVSNKKVMVEVDGFDMPFLLRDLLLVKENNEVVSLASIKNEEDEHLSFEEIDDEKRSEDWLLQFQKRKNEKGIPEIDIHIHELVGDFKNLSNHEMRQLQLEYCRNCIETAIKHGVQRFVIIHGVGEGKLRTDVRNTIDYYQNLKWEDASYKLYGYGATEVFVFQTKKKF